MTIFQVGKLKPSKQSMSIHQLSSILSLLVRCRLSIERLSTDPHQPMVLGLRLLHCICILLRSLLRFHQFPYLSSNTIQQDSSDRCDLSQSKCLMGMAEA